jgi:hypothetical protein
MWIAKGTLLGLWLFGFGTMTYFYFAIFRHMPPNSAVDVRIITALTIQNPLWWAALVLSFVIGFANRPLMARPASCGSQTFLISKG